MQTVTDIFDQFGGPSQLRAEVAPDQPYTTVASWKARSSIPPHVFPQLVAASQRLNIEGITLEFLHGLHAPVTKAAAE